MNRGILAWICIEWPRVHLNGAVQKGELWIVAAGGLIPSA